MASFAVTISMLDIVFLPFILNVGGLAAVGVKFIGVLASYPVPLLSGILAFAVWLLPSTLAVAPLTVLIVLRLNSIFKMVF